MTKVNLTSEKQPPRTRGLFHLELPHEGLLEHSIVRVKHPILCSNNTDEAPVLFGQDTDFNQKWLASGA